jgi:hypothetical protein
MFLERYEVKISDHHTIFKFQSIGKKGIILKSIQYEKLQPENFYNLGFGDFNEVTGELDDLVVTDNGDFEKVLATVATSVYIFTKEYPESWVLIRGSTPSRIRLYQIGITKYFQEITQEFNILGYFEGDWLPFESNKKYSAFLINKKVV